LLQPLTREQSLTSIDNNEEEVSLVEIKLEKGKNAGVLFSKIKKRKQYKEQQAKKAKVVKEDLSVKSMPVHKQGKKMRMRKKRKIQKMKRKYGEQTEEQT